MFKSEFVSIDFGSYFLPSIRFNSANMLALTKQKVNSIQCKLSTVANALLVTAVLVVGLVGSESHHYPSTNSPAAAVAAVGTIISTTTANLPNFTTNRLKRQFYEDQSGTLGKSKSRNLSGKSQQILALEQAKIICEEQNVTNYENDNEDLYAQYCPSVWDGALCWPKSPANTVVKQPCPNYVKGFYHDGTAYKNCTKNGLWYFNKETDNYWTDYRECTPTTLTTHDELSLSLETSDPKIIKLKPHIRNFQLISRLGYSISFTSLLVAFFILVYVKFICRRLRCPRNSLHLQLFVSFIIRSLMYLTKAILDAEREQKSAEHQIHHNMGDIDSVLSDEASSQNFMTLSNNYDNGILENTWSHSVRTSTMSCKIFTAIWQYSLLANYNWIFMEGLYLHNVIFFNIFNDNSNIIPYIFLGWGLPIPIVALWGLMRSFYEDTYCWKTNNNFKIFWIMRAPITISIILNFFFFVNIIRVLFLKMFAKSAANYAQKYKYRTWFRSTLVLMPLFGVHYMIFLAFTTITFNSYDIFEIIWLYTDLTFTTFQGCLVALLYCFFNNEVQIELKKIWFVFKQNLTSSQLLRTNSNTQPHHSYSRTRNSFMSNIDCNSFFKKEEQISHSSEMNVDKAVFNSCTGNVVITHHCNNGHNNHATVPMERIKDDPHLANKEEEV